MCSERPPETVRGKAGPLPVTCPASWILEKGLFEACLSLPCRVPPPSPLKKMLGLGPSSVQEELCTVTRGLSSTRSCPQSLCWREVASTFWESGSYPKPLVLPPPCLACED